MTPDTMSQLLGNVERYYSNKLETHGPVPQGVDWKDKDSQKLRFEQLLQIRRSPGSFSINDIGCGLGCLAETLQNRNETFEYHGADISPAMIRTAQKKFLGRPNIYFHTKSADLPTSDFSVASGIFNVRLGHDDHTWKRYIETVLLEMDRLSKRGFAFNMLTSYSDADRMRPDLFYADPSYYFDFCKQRFARNVALLHDYGLFEFTLLVRKDP